MQPSALHSSPLQRVLEKLAAVAPSGNGFKARCPAHEDKKASLSVCADSDGKVLIKCFAGCRTELVVQSIGLSMRDLFPSRSETRPKQDRTYSTEEIRTWPSTQNVYVYRDRDGSPLFLVVRTRDKKFRQYRSVGPDTWQSRLAGTKRVLYRLPEVLAAVKAGQTVFIVEGEKDAETLVAIGLDATCNPMGAGKWRAGYSEDLRGARVVILPDNDKPGRDHAREVARSLAGVAEEIRVVELPDLPPKGDVSDWLATGKTRESLECRVSATAPVREDELRGLAKDAVGGEAGSADPGEGLADAVTSAMETWGRLLEQLKADRNAPIEPAVYEALAVLQAHAPVEWVAVKRRMKEYGIPQQPVEMAIKAIRKARLRLVAPGEEPVASTAGEMLPDAPLPDLVIPEGYFLREDATGYEVETLGSGPERRTIAFAPILITGRLYDADEGTSFLRLEWRRGEGWRRAVVDRGIALNARRMVELASVDFPVAGGNAKDLENYLHRLEAANRATLPLARVSSHLGWQGKDGLSGFLWGRTLLLPDGETMTTVDLDEEDPRRWRKDWVTFRSQTAGDEQIADAYHAKGTLGSWFDAVKCLKDYPKALLALYAAFVPPLLPIVDAPNFIIDWCGRTSTGKTTALRVAASVWGRPDERDPNSAIATWDATRVWMERTTSILNGLPLILDDTKRVRYSNQVAEVLYAVASGRGRGRGNLKSTAVTGHWRTVLLSSGEAPATSFTQDGGTRTRTIEIRGMPFGRPNEESGRLVHLLSSAIRSNYGHAGPAFVLWLIKNRDRWGRFAQEYRTRVEDYAKGESNEAGRLAQYAAAIDMAAALVHVALNRPWEFKPPLQTLWQDIVREAQDAAGEVRTLQELFAWACRHETSFYGRHRSLEGAPVFPKGEAFGRWDGGEGWGYIAFSPDVLKRVLKEFGHEQPEAILAGWKERDWLDVDADRYTKVCRMGDGKRPRLVVIMRSAFVEAEACGEAGVGLP